MTGNRKKMSSFALAAGLQSTFSTLYGKTHFVPPIFFYSIEANTHTQALWIWSESRAKNLSQPKAITIWIAAPMKQPKRKKNAHTHICSGVDLCFNTNKSGAIALRCVEMQQIFLNIHTIQLTNDHVSKMDIYCRKTDIPWAERCLLCRFKCIIKIKRNK